MNLFVVVWAKIIIYVNNQSRKGPIVLCYKSQKPDKKVGFTQNGIVSR